MIKTLDTPISVEYVFGPESIYKVETTILPIIIDYGKSHIVYESKHHGLINMYQMNLFQDSFTMLCTSGAEIIQKRLERYDLSVFMNLFNWLTNSQFIQNRFNTVKDIKDFLFTSRKYTYILTEDKKDIIKRNPIEFVEFLINRFRYSIRVSRPKVKSVNRLVLSPDTLLKLHENVDIRTVFSHIRDTCVFKNSIKFFNMFEYFYISRHLNHVMQTINIYNNSLMPIAQTEYIATLNYMRQKLEQTEYTPISYTIFEDKHKELYTYKDFYNPTKLLELVHTLNLKDKYQNYIQYRHHIVDMMLSNIFNGDNLLYLTTNFNDLVKSEPFNQWAIISDIKTLQFVIKRIIRDDIKNIIQQVKSKKKNDDCTDALKTLELYKRIIKLII
jgi:hypothetical protein